MKAMLALAMLGTMGCGQALDTTEKPYQWEAVSAIWSALGARGQVPPIVWVSPDAKCSPGFDAHGVCSWGAFSPHENVIRDIWRGTFHQSTIAHELIHAWQWNDRAVFDPTHSLKDDWGAFVESRGDWERPIAIEVGIEQMGL